MPDQTTELRRNGSLNREGVLVGDGNAIPNGKIVADVDVGLVDLDARGSDGGLCHDDALS